MNLGIICEFNPFHKGHKYLIDSVKGKDDCVICAMSGNFVQRGEFAVYDKFTRAKTAVENGADLVIEIPTVFALRSAQGFAQAGVALLEGTGVCEGLAFGAECADTKELKRVAEMIKSKADEIKEELKKGISYPAARQNIINSPLLETPNNILAVEYVSCTKLKTVAVERIGKGHDSDDNEYSASEIRKHLDENEISSIKNCERAVLYKLRNMKAEDFARIEDVSEGLENRIAEAVKTATTLDELYELIKTKRYTHSRIRRIILRAYLGIEKVPEKPQYIRVLAFNEKGRDLLAQIKKSSALPVIVKYSDAKALGGEILESVEQEFRLTDVYNLGYKNIKPCNTEQTNKVEVIR